MSPSLEVAIANALSALAALLNAVTAQIKKEGLKK
jgi:hypothetical protein